MGGMGMGNKMQTLQHQGVRSPAASMTLLAQVHATLLGRVHLSTIVYQQLLQDTKSICSFEHKYCIRIAASESLAQKSVLKSTYPQVILVCVDSYVLPILPKLSYTSDCVTNIDFSDHTFFHRGRRR